MSKILIFLLFLASFLFFISVSETKAACYNNIQDNLPNGIVDGDVDHYDLECFNEIPDNWINQAGSLKLLFVDRSVGVNISEGLDCISSGVPYGTAPNSCDSGLTEETYVSDLKYNRSNWDYAHYADGGWYDNVSNFILNQNLRNLNQNPWTPDYSSYDVFNFQFSYLSVAQGSNIVGSTGYFRPFPGDTNRIRDVHDMEAFENSHPDKIFVQATTSLARSIGGSTSFEFNNLMRQYAKSSNRILIDFADIGSHDSFGNNCVDTENYPVLCPEYTSEATGGHLSEGIAVQRMAKAMWIMMAGVAGWEPGSASSPQPTSYPTPTSSSVPITPTPTNTNLPGDATGDGVVDGIDYLVWLNNYGYSRQGIENGDFDLSGNVDGLDYVIWLNNYNI